MDEEIVDLVTKNGKTYGQAKRKDVYQKGLLHQAVSVLVINTNKKLFLQQRSAGKSFFPLYWDISVSEHLIYGELYKDAAIRGLKEELSIEKAPVELIRKRHIQKTQSFKGDSRIKEYELVELYATVYDGIIKTNKNEVKTGRFVEIKELERYNSLNFTPWGLDEVKFILKNPNTLNSLF
jgi:isopentenyl-diphosphate delta-isomerase